MFSGTWRWLEKLLTHRSVLPEVFSLYLLFCDQPPTRNNWKPTLPDNCGVRWQSNFQGPGNKWVLHQELELFSRAAWAMEALWRPSWPYCSEVGWAGKVPPCAASLLKVLNKILSKAMSTGKILWDWKLGAALGSPEEFRKNSLTFLVPSLWFHWSQQQSSQWPHLCRTESRNTALVLLPCPWQCHQLSPALNLVLAGGWRMKESLNM